LNLKIRVDHLLIAGSSVIVLVAAVLTWRAVRPDPERAKLDDGLEQLRKSSRSPGAQPPPRFVRDAFSSRSRPAGSERGEGWAVPQTPPEGDPGDLDADEAIDSFKAVMTELETALEDQRRLSEVEQLELYNRATGSFTAMSAWVDGSDPNERALIDDAYAQMMALMRALELRPPAHDPDHLPPR
jgi:hypothetical protein